MSTVEHILLFYAGLLLFNTLISALLWLHQKTRQHKILLLMWLFASLSFLTQGLFQKTDISMILSYSTMILPNFTLAVLLANLLQERVPWRYLFKGAIAAYGVTLFFYLIGIKQFYLLALPISFICATPLFYMGSRAIKKWHTLTLSGKSYTLVCLFLAIHALDYAFIRKLEYAEVFGFSLAILFALALTIFAPAVILEILTKSKAQVEAKLDIARQIQSEILPKKPTIPMYELECYMRPAEEVGGDYYDVYNFKDKSWIFIGDVTGHGLASGLVMFMVQSIVTTILQTNASISPRELNFLTNNVLCNNLQRLNEQRPMTLLSLCLDSQHRITLSSSHDMLYVYRHKDKTVTLHETRHFPVGIGFSDSFGLEDFEESSLVLDEGDLALLCTDGITEAAYEGDIKKGTFEDERLKKFIEKNANLPLTHIKSNLIAYLDSFTTNIYTDDITFVLLRHRQKVPHEHNA